MSFENDLYSLLIADTGVSGVVGSRCYPNVLPENGTFPAVVFKLIDDPIEVAHDGPVGLRSKRYQFDVYAALKADSIAGKDAIDALFKTIAGTFGATVIQGATRRNGADFYERETRLFRNFVEWEIWHVAT